jgi:rhombotail lipoprotein
MRAMKFHRALGLSAAVALAGATFFLAGCSSLFDGPRKADRSSSVVQFLYPGESNPLPPTDIPVLRLPLRVGVAFVPTPSGNQWSDTGVTEMQKAALMERIAKEFRSKEFIQSIELIPSSYLRPGGGFTNLDQLTSLLGIDVIALVAYDQVQFSNENRLSLAYWTIVGAYIFKGNKNDTHTLMEAAVYDIRSRHLLFRAPGASQVHSTSTMVAAPQELRAASSSGFDQATDDLIKNLQVQLELFRERAKRAPETVKIEHRPGYTGGGASGAWFAAAILVLGLSRRLWLRRARA